MLGIAEQLFLGQFLTQLYAKEHRDTNHFFSGIPKAVP